MGEGGGDEGGEGGAAGFEGVSSTDILIEPRDGNPGLFYAP